VNENYRELKTRIREVNKLLLARGTGNLEFAQAVSRVRRAAKRGDRTRDPSQELRGLLEKAEHLARAIAGQAEG
jgi:hypothetical protein